MSSPLSTIAAIATPPGKGGVAIIRVSGENVSSIMQKILGSRLIPRKAHYLPFKDHQQQALDEGLAIFFPSPNSFTGEDVLELHAHGGPVINDLLLKEILTLGARLARPGEFTERAFLNNKIDLTQAEAVADLINAASKQAARSAVRSLQGEFSLAINSLNKKLIDLRMYLEAAIDFSDEAIDFASDNELKEKTKELIDYLHEIQQKAQQGSLLREGINIVIVGEPNVGKSTLLNALSGKDLAIVTDIPGTTRDVLRDSVVIDGIPLHIIDTAGLRESTDTVEQEGIRRAKQEMQNADLILLMSDNKISSSHHENAIYIRNKIDLNQEQPSVKTEEGKTVVAISAKTGLGLDLLKEQIKNKIGYRDEADGVFLARRRHLDALSKAAQHIQQSLFQLKEYKSAELAAEELRIAHSALGEITGDFSADDLLGKIFSSFCIGK